MAHYAKVENNIVSQVLVAEQDFVDTQDGDWVQTSFNTSGGVHANGGTPLRKNYASVGMTYDSIRDAFYTPQPYSSWTLNDDSCIWEAPTAMPDDGLLYTWDEGSATWVEEGDTP